MATLVEVLGLAVIVLVHTATAALLTRFFRVRLATGVGAALFVGLASPVVLFVLTLVFGGVLGLGPDLGSAGAVLALTILLPLSLGVAFDYFWMPAPNEIDVPAEPEESRPGTRR